MGLVLFLDFRHPALYCLWILFSMPSISCIFLPELHELNQGKNMRCIRCSSQSDLLTEFRIFALLVNTSCFISKLLRVGYRLPPLIRRYLRFNYRHDKGCRSRSPWLKVPSSAEKADQSPDDDSSHSRNDLHHRAHICFMVLFLK